jgi:hypothetical protein
MTLLPGVLFYKFDCLGYFLMRKGHIDIEISFFICNFDWLSLTIKTLRAMGKFKPIFERSLTEQSSLLKKQIKNIQRENLNLGLYNSYRDELCVSNDLLIHEYHNRKELVRVNSQTGKVYTVKTFS